MDRHSAIETVRYTPGATNGLSPTQAQTPSFGDEAGSRFTGPAVALALPQIARPGPQRSTVTFASSRYAWRGEPCKFAPRQMKRRSGRVNGRVDRVDSLVRLED